MDVGVVVVVPREGGPGMDSSSSTHMQRANVVLCVLDGPNVFHRPPGSEAIEQPPGKAPSIGKNDAAGEA